MKTLEQRVLELETQVRALTAMVKTLVAASEKPFYTEVGGIPCWDHVQTTSAPRSETEILA